MTTKIFTRSINYELYRRSQSLIRMELPRVRLTNTTADGYFYKMLADTSCNWAINIDEDAFVINEEAVADLLAFMQHEGIVGCGMSDSILVRPGNPIVVNPYFNIFNLEAIRKRFSTEQVAAFDHRSLLDRYTLPPDRFIADQQSLLLDREEPFYKFFLWMAYNFHMLYLDAVMHPDGISTILYNHRNKPMLYHSWFSRCWRKDEVHTKRIDALYRQAATERGMKPLSAALALVSPVDRGLQIARRKCHSVIKRINSK